MTVSFSENTRQPVEGYHLLQQATRQLEELMGALTEEVSATWDRVQDARGRSVYRLVLSDSAAEASSTFTLGDLQSPGRRSRLLDLWGDFLQASSNERVKKLQELVAGGD
jgi:hypothetical protein